jgi:hypothetical protein
VDLPVKIANYSVQSQQELTQKTALNHVQERERQFSEMMANAEHRTQTIEDLIVEEMNKKHAVIHIDQFFVLTEKPHALFQGRMDFTLESRQSFLNTYENQLVECTDGKSRSKGKVWLAHPNRRQFDGITFDPTTTHHRGSLYNIWRGFTEPPVKGNCDLYWEHVKNVICGSIAEYYSYVRKWLAHLVQKPHVVTTGLVLMGKQGTGKNTFVDPIGKLFGAHYLPLDNIQQLLGQFNFHLKNAALIHANEAVWGGNRKELGVLKAMVTDEFSVIEGKGKDRIVVRNFKHVIISSNEDWPVALDRDDRRFLVLRVSDVHKEDIPYFKAIQEQLNSGGLQALLYDLMNEAICDFDPRIIPQNTEAFDVKLMSVPTTDLLVKNMGLWLIAFTWQWTSPIVQFCLIRGSRSIDRIAQDESRTIQSFGATAMSLRP